MDNNAFTAGVVPGGLTNYTEIKIMICYLLGALGQPFHHDDMLEALAGQGYANYFESAGALSDLLDAGHIAQDIDGRYTLRPSGSEIAQVLLDDLPVTVRERVLFRARELARLRRNQKSHRADITETENGFHVRCAVTDTAGHELFALELDAPSRSMAQRIRDNFVAHAEGIMRYCITTLTEEEL